MTSPPRWQRLIDVLHLARLEVVFSAVSNGWLVVFLAWAVEPAGFRNPHLVAWGPAGGLLLAGLVGAGLSAYGIALNDVLDMRHDRAFSPHRPVASGRVSLRAALVLALLGLLTGLAASVLLGPVSALLCLFNALGILFYNTTWKYLPAAGIVTLGLIRALNMIVINPWLGFVFPVWLAMTHAMACATAVHLLHGKRPRLGRWEWWLVGAGWLFWGGLLVGAIKARGGDILPASLWGWALPLAAAGLFAGGWAVRLRRPIAGPRSRRARALAFERAAMLWLIVYDAMVLAGVGAHRPAALLGGLLLLAAAVTALLHGMAHVSRDPMAYAIRPLPARKER